ncbi:hypothetical protein Vafri_1198 [Volvox africanus]|nr:hypothetical protein Vafri_1198 [Volvox africanus]
MQRDATAAAAPNTAIAEPDCPDHTATDGDGAPSSTRTQAASTAVNQTGNCDNDMDRGQEAPPAEGGPPYLPAGVSTQSSDAAAPKPGDSLPQQQQRQPSFPLSQPQLHVADEAHDPETSPTGRSLGRTGSRTRGGSGKKGAKAASSADPDAESSPPVLAAAPTTRTTRSRAAAAAAVSKPPADATDTGEGSPDEPHRRGGGSAAPRDVDSDEPVLSGRTSAGALDRQTNARGSARGRKQPASSEPGEEATAAASRPTRSKTRTAAARRSQGGGEEEGGPGPGGPPAPAPPSDPMDDGTALTTRRSVRKESTGAAAVETEVEAAGRGGQGGSGAQEEEVAAPAAAPAPVEVPSVAPPTDAPVVVEIAGMETEQVHEDEDTGGDPDGKGARTRGGTTTAAAKAAAGRAKGRYGAGRAGTRGAAQRRSSATEEKAKAATEDEAKVEASATAEDTAPPATAPTPPAAAAAISERRAEDTIMEDAPGTSAASPPAGQRQKRHRADTVQPASAIPSGAPGSATPVQAATTAATPAAAVTTITTTTTTTAAAAAAATGSGEADGEDALGAAGRARAAKRQTVKPSANPIADSAGPTAPTTKTSTAGGGAPGPAAGAAAGAAATVASAAATPGPTAAAAGNGGGGSSSGSSFEGRLSDRIAAALVKLEQARIQEAEAVLELNNCAQAMYDRPFNFQLYKHSKLAIMVMRASKTAAKAVTGGVLTGEAAGSVAAGGASSATAVSNGGTHALAQVAADMKGIVAVIKRLNEAKVPQTQESLREAMQNLGITAPVLTVPPAAPPPPALPPPAPTAPTAADVPPHHIVSAFTTTGEPLRDKAIAVLAHALSSVTPVHPVQAALAIEAQLARQHGAPSAASASASASASAAPSAAAAGSGEAYLARLRWLCDLLANDGAHFVPEVGKLVLDGKLSPEELVRYEGSGGATGATAAAPPLAPR